MSRGAAIAACGIAAMALAAGGVADAKPRRHRLHLPVPTLGKSLTVDEFEFTLRPSKIAVAAGRVRIKVYNRGEDDHNLLVVDRKGRTHLVELKPKTSGSITPTLAAGRYKLYCSLFEGTPESHEKRGMRFELSVY